MENHFKTLEIEENFDLSEDILEQAYLAMQIANHPDKFALKPQHEKIASLKKTVDINYAYEILKNPALRAVHLLKIKTGDDSILKDRTISDAKILNEIIGLQEQLLENKEAAKIEISDLIKICYQKISEAFKSNDFETAKTETLRMQYLLGLIR